MAQINLLPKDLAPRAAVIKTTGLIKKILTLGFLLFILSAIGLGASYLLISKNLQESQAKVKELKANVKALEQTEQRLLLTKDRLEKAKLVLGTATAGDEIDSASAMLGNLPIEVGLTSADFKEEESNISLNAPNSELMAKTISSIKTSGLYKNIDMESFNFTPEQGFLMNFVLIR